MTEEQKFDKIKIVSDKHSKGTHIYLNGKKLKFVTDIQFSVSVGEYNKIIITMMGDIEIEAETENLEIKEKTFKEED